KTVDRSPWNFQDPKLWWQAPIKIIRKFNLSAADNLITTPVIPPTKTAVSSLVGGGVSLLHRFLSHFDAIGGAMEEIDDILFQDFKLSIGSLSNSFSAFFGSIES